MTSTRTETDSIGKIDVPADKYWGAQTERSRRNFPIGGEAERILCLGPIASGDRLLDFFDERANASGARDIDRGATDSLANSFLRRFVVRHDLTSCELCRGGLYRLPPSRSTD